MRRTSTFVMLLALAAALARAAEIPPRPEKLTYPPLTYTVPDAKAMRATLANGVPVYIVEDRLLPLVTVQVMFRGGRYLEPAGKEGLAALTGTVWRAGGAGMLNAAAFDDELDLLAAQLSTSVGDTSGMVSLNLLAKDLDRGVALLMDVLLSPSFEQSRLDRAKQDMLAEMRRRNDDTADIEAREWSRLVYGDGYWLNRLATQASVDGITREEVVAFQKTLVNPANFVLAVAGDFDRAAMLARLDAAVGRIRATRMALPPPPQPQGSAPPGVYLVDKKDVNQGRVSLGHLGALRPVPDEAAIEVANDILGGGGFTAWMMARVRSAEGLAYGAYSAFGIGDTVPGVFRANFQSKSATCARAAQLTVELIGKLLAGKVADAELATSKNSFIETFPRTFETRLKTASRFARDELVGLPHEHWGSYRGRIAAVGAEAVHAAARSHIDPDRLIVLVVGDVDEILQGSPDHPTARFETLGPFVRLPLRDPMTLKPTG